MKTFATLALLALPTTFAAAPAASADTTADVAMSFRYVQAAPVEATYADLNRKALNACARTSGHAMISRAERACAASLVTKAINSIGDTRLAELNGQPLRQAMAANSGR